jgi:hypothetical protein
MITKKQRKALRFNYRAALKHQQAGTNREIGVPERLRAKAKEAGIDLKYIPPSFETTIAKYTTAGEAGCLIWNGPVSGDGTPMICYQGERMGARKALHHHTTGKLVERGKYVSNCKNITCVAPDHTRVPLSNEDMTEIVERVKAGERHTEIAVCYGVRRETISRIAARHIVK